MAICTARRVMARPQPLTVPADEPILESPADEPILESPADEPILESKVTVPGVPGWAIQRPQITKLISQGHAPVPADRDHRPARVGQDDGSDVVGSGPASGCCLAVPRRT